MTATSSRDHIVQQIKETADIAGVVGEVVALRRSGVNLKGLCPFHAEKTPSFMVSPERQSFHCFGCGEGGDVFSFVMKYHNLTFPEALKQLAAKYHIELPETHLAPQEKARAKKRDDLFEANEQAAALFHKFLLHDKAAAPARDYLEKRAIPRAVIEKFRLGFAPQSWDFLYKQLSAAGSRPEILFEAGLVARRDKGGYYDRFRQRILCPIHNAMGRVVAFGGRILGEGQPKYLNSPESEIFDKGRTLFGLYPNREAIRAARRCLVVEGNFDLLALVANGIENVVAPLGTALTSHQVRALKGYADEIVLLFDGDSAGLKAALRGVSIFLAEQVQARIATLPAGHDPDTYVRQNGPAALSDLIAQAAPLSEYVYQYLASRYGTTLEGKSRMVGELKPLVEAIEDPAQRHLFATHFGDRLGVPAEQLLPGRSTLRATAQTAKKAARHRDGGMPLNNRQLLEFLLAYPQYLSRFLEAGIEEIIDSSQGQAVLALLKGFMASGSTPAPDNLLLHIDGPEKGFISEMLISAPSYAEEERGQVAEEKIAWLQKMCLKRKMEELTMQINAAQKANDVERCMELIARKRELEKAPAA